MKLSMLWIICGIFLLCSLAACGGKDDKGIDDQLSLPAPVLISPEKGTNTRDKEPQFQWKSVVGATRYTIEVKQADDNTIVAKKSYDHDSRCDSDVCSIPSPVTLVPGVYKWHVTAWIGDLKTEWSAYWTLTIE